MTKQRNQYDKIFKENIEAAIPGLIERLLGIRALTSEELPDALQHTREREPDVLKKIKDTNGDIFILQVEFQVTDESEMVYRMAEYYLMLYRKYQLEVAQYVLYLGEKPPGMCTKLETRKMTFRFPLITLSEVDYRLFLASNQPEEVIFALLGDFGSDRPEEALGNIIRRVEETTQSDFALKRKWVQLRILSQLRSLVIQTGKLMEGISTFFKEENDILYKRGIEKGIATGMSRQELLDKRAFTISLIRETTFDNGKIARLTGVAPAFVQHVREEIANS